MDSPEFYFKALQLVYYSNLKIPKLINELCSSFPMAYLSLKDNPGLFQVSTNFFLNFESMPSVSPLLRNIGQEYNKQLSELGESDL